jgi:glycosyltransferase involved in cell wall biosynthesis
MRRLVSPRYDLYIHFFAGGDVSQAIRASVRLLIPSGNLVPPDMAARFDYIGLQAPDNVNLAPRGSRTILLPPPVFELSETVVRPTHDLPERYYLTVFNPYSSIKGVDDLVEAVETAPHPIVWCHTEATASLPLPAAMAKHPRILHIEGPSPAELRYLYQNCLAYLCFSRSEGFGWSVADGLRYSGCVVSRPLGVFSYPEAKQDYTFEVGERWQVDWSSLPTRPAPSIPRTLEWLSPDMFRDRLVSLCRRTGDRKSG